MFKQLAGLLANNTAVSLLISGSAEAMTVTVVPKIAKALEGQGALATPLVLNGSAEELDNGFSDLVANFTSDRLSLAEQYQATASVLEAAKKESASKAAKGIAKSAKAVSAKPASSSDEGGDDEEEDAESTCVDVTDQTPVASTEVPTTDTMSNLFA